MARQIPAFLAFCAALAGLSVAVVTYFQPSPRTASSPAAVVETLPEGVAEVRAALADELVVYYEAPVIEVRACPPGQTATTAAVAGQRSPCS